MQLNWTLNAYRALLTDPVVLKAFDDHPAISLIVTAVCLVLGYPVAIGIARAGRWRPLLIFLLITPMLTDVLIRAYGWIVMLGQRGLVNALITSLGLWNGRSSFYTPSCRVIFSSFRSSARSWCCP